MSEKATATELPQPTGRPFPWYCPRCRHQEVWRQVVAYHCERLYDGQPIMVTIADLAVPKCGNCGELVFDYLAEEQINLVFQSLTSSLDKTENGTPIRSSTGEKQSLT